jgi:glycosyltransferase involved in cell wall biosynthesis
MKLKIAAIIPLYNKARTIRRAIESVLIQTEGVTEVIVVDDGSTDDSAAVVRGIANPLVKLISQTNSGEGVARNQGIRQSNAEVLAFLDADDQWKPWFCERIVGLLQDFPEADAAGTGYGFCFPNGKEYPAPMEHILDGEKRGTIHNYFRVAVGKPPLTCSSVAMRRSVFGKAGYWPHLYHRGMDLAMFTAVALNCTIAFDTRAAATYHIEAENRICRNRVIRTQHLAVDRINDVLAARALDPGLRFQLERYRAYLMLDTALQNVAIGDGRLARAMISRYNTSRDLLLRREAIRVMSYLPSSMVRAGFHLWSRRRYLRTAASAAQTD